VASGHLSPPLTELAEFLLTATVLVGTGRKAVNSEYMRKLLKEDGLNAPCCLNFLMRAACACAAPPRWCRPRYQRRQGAMPTAGMVRTLGRFGISAWLRRSGARRHPWCRWERTARDPRRDRRHSYASPCPRCPVVFGEGLGSCQSLGHATFFFSQTRVTRATPISRPGYPSVSRGWPHATAANTHLRPLLAGLPEFLLAATRDVRLAGHGARPRIRPIACADSSGFARNPAAGLSAISSA
jgi:hypothetical protein